MSGTAPDASPDSRSEMSARLSFQVSSADTATALGSGDVDVLATPRLLAWCEAATVAALRDLPPGATSVGTHVRLDHLLATPVGAVLDVEARLDQADGRQRRFAVVATDRQGRTVGAGEVTRAVVDREHFAARARS